MAPIAVLHCIITLYDLSRPLRLTYCTIISLSLSLSFIEGTTECELYFLQSSPTVTFLV